MEVLQHSRPLISAGVVCLVHHEQVEKLRRQLVKPAGEGLDAGNLHGMGQVHAAAGLDAAMRNAHGGETAAGLVEQFSAVHKDTDAVALFGGRLGDVAEAHRLAAAGWQHCQHRAVAELVLQADVGDELGLVGS